MKPVFPLGAVAGLSALEHLINKTLQLDPVTLDKLQLLEHKTLLLHLTQPEVVLGVTWIDGRIVLKGLPEQVDASLMATLPAALALLTHKDKIAALQSGDVTISGDTALLQQTLAILQDAELDWESVLTDKLGTVAGHALGQGIRTFFSWAKDTNQRFSRNAAEYVTEEARLVVSAAEVEVFCEDVTSLQLDMDRLNARIEQLEPASDTSNHGS
ncbi:ubiquinone biosynthesis accessory factor UbiJ [Spongorhabdus nitratireducens]